MNPFLRMNPRNHVLVHEIGHMVVSRFLGYNAFFRLRADCSGGDCFTYPTKRTHKVMVAIAGHVAEAIWHDRDALAHVEYSFENDPPQKPTRTGGHYGVGGIGNDAHLAGKHWRKHLPEVERILRENWATVMDEMTRAWGAAA